jgi:hypothetical protein
MKTSMGAKERFRRIEKVSEQDKVFESGSFVFNSGGEATIVVAGSSEPREWTATTTYFATNINPDLRLQLKIGEETFLLAPNSPPTSTHTAKGAEVSYTCLFLAGVNLLVGWSASS